MEAIINRMVLNMHAAFKGNEAGGRNLWVTYSMNKEIYGFPYSVRYVQKQAAMLKKIFTLRPVGRSDGTEHHSLVGTCLFRD